MQNISKAFTQIPVTLPTVPVFTPREGKDLFAEGHYNPNAYNRKYGIYTEGIIKYNAFVKDYKQPIQDALQKAGEAIMHLNDYEDR